MSNQNFLNPRATPDIGSSGAFIEIDKYRNLTFIEKRETFLRKLISICNYETKKYEIINPIAITCNKGDKFTCNKFDKFYSNYIPEFKLYTLQGKEELPNGEYFDGLNFKKEWDTRDILLSEAVLEIEKGNWETNIKGFWETVKNLTRLNIEFFVFYTEGMRTPHIHIYNLFPNVFDWAEKEMCMGIFCRKVVPLEYFHLIDTALWGEHGISLEFSKHYKYGTMNRLIWWNIPQEKNICN